APRGGIDGQHRDRAPELAPAAHERGQERRLARAGRPCHAHEVGGRLGAEGGGCDLGQQLPRPLAAGPRAVLDEVQGRRRGASIPLAQPATQLRRFAGGGSRRAQAAAAAEWCSATRSTMSPMIRVISKSFGVYTRATPFFSNHSASAGGMIPPTITGTSAPASLSWRRTWGMSS